MEQLVSELLDSKNYKQAQKQLKTKLKKSPDDVSLLVLNPRFPAAQADSFTQILQAQVYLASGELHECDTLCSKLCTRKPPITHIDHLNRIFSTACRLKLRDPSVNVSYAATLWNAAMLDPAVKVKRAVYAREWASLSIQHRQWDLLAKSTSALIKSAKDGEKRKYFFWQIMAFYMASFTLYSNPGAKVLAEKDINRQLALRYLEKAAKDTPEVPEVGGDVTPGLWISKPSELRLLLRAFHHQGRSQDALEILQKPRMQQIARHLPDFGYIERAIYDKIDQRAVWTWACQVLASARSNGDLYLVDNWFYWQGLLEGEELTFELELEGEKVDSEFVTNASLDLMEDYNRDDNTLSRAPQLARFILLWRLETRTQNSVDSKKQELFKEHFQCHSGEIFVCDDLYNYLEDFDNREYLQVRKSIGQVVENLCADGESPEHAQLKWLGSEVNALKIDWRFILSHIIVPVTVSERGQQVVGNALQRVELLEEFVCNCIRLYQLSRTRTGKTPEKMIDRGDEACFMAIEGLRALTGLLKDYTYQIKALCLLDYLVTESKYNTAARLELVILAKEFGLASIAWKAYKDLDVKKILCDSFCPHFFCRIGTFHPFPSPDLDVYKAMEAPLKFYDDSISEIADYQEMALNHENYYQVLYMEQFAHNLRDSATRVMLVFERRRIARLTGKAYDKHEPLFDTFNAAEYVTFADAPAPRNSQLNAGTIVSAFSKDYLNAMIALDAALDIAASPLQDQADLLKMRRKEFDVVYGRVQQNAHVDPFATHETKNFKITFSEQSSLAVGHWIIEVVFSMASEIRDLSNFQIALETLKEKLGHTLACVLGKLELSEEEVFLQSSWYHDFYLGLELCQACYKLSTKTLTFIQQKLQSAQAGQRSKLNIAAKGIKLVAEKHFNEIREQASAHKKKLVRCHEDEMFVQGFVGIPKDELEEGWEPDAPGLAMQDLMGFQRIKQILYSFVESEKSTLDGVFQVKLE